MIPLFEPLQAEQIVNKIKELDNSNFLTVRTLFGLDKSNFG